VLCILCSALFATMIANFGGSVNRKMQISRCTDYLRHESWTTGGGEHELRSDSWCGTIVPLRVNHDEMGLVSYLQQCDSVAIYDAIMQIKRLLGTWTGRFIYEIGIYQSH
jgi:hypothetical protein